MEAARQGDRAALEIVVRAIETSIYNLALRMLANRIEAQDATQEILIKVITHLGSLDNVGAVGGWVMRIAARHLVRERKRGRIESMSLTFSGFAEDLENGLSTPDQNDLTPTEMRLALAEVRVGCTMAMLLCLSRDARMAYLLGEIFELTDGQAADILEITRPAFRQRLKRARQLVHGFMMTSCGLANPDAVCRCEKRLIPALKCGRVVKGRSQLGLEGHSILSNADLNDLIDNIDIGRRSVAIMRSNPKLPGMVSARLFQILDEKASSSLS